MVVAIAAVVVATTPALCPNLDTTHKESPCSGSSPGPKNNSQFRGVNQDMCEYIIKKVTGNGIYFKIKGVPAEQLNEPKSLLCV
ncbi:hypothetical protein Y1Q_0021875 [Alligator mississippiensis]|uniref:Uncharacterized protein n=1 Tax=Alligator mississippiensis TaxID=8496 RepID=A0A151M683_ALLMI|nr:hypothetical protein Y1Q_0021875 [Alligator mississippiensis]